MAKRLTTTQKFAYYSQRQRLGDTQILAERLGVTPQTISNITNMIDPINAKTANEMFKLAYSREKNMRKIGKLFTILNTTDYVPAWELRAQREEAEAKSLLAKLQTLPKEVKKVVLSATKTKFGKAVKA